MLTRRRLPAFMSLAVVSCLLTFLSCDIDAKQQKQSPVKSARTTRAPKCCKAGFFLCPTGGVDGCDCCGASVTATLTDYKNKKGTLKIDGIDERDGVPFVVENAGVDNALSKMVGQTGKFILKLKPKEYDLDPNDKPYGKTNLKHWYRLDYECEKLGDENGKMQDRTKEFAEGWKMSAAVQDLQATLDGLVEKYPPERDEDKRP